MRLNRRVIDFNKEILIGEIGAILGAPIFGFISSFILKNPLFISFATLGGSIVGGSVSWLTTRIYDEKKYREFSRKKFTKDLSLFTPVAFLISILASYPTVLFVTKTMFSENHSPFFSSLAGELSGFAIFLILINTYRFVMNHSFNKFI
ncbi:MAG: hypothetical protein M1165_01130 [Candidatus Pacearchaeota archaeon]|nr:hypothetical protein [Candidatus Pacearchaeota archaeon]